MALTQSEKARIKQTVQPLIKRVQYGQPTQKQTMISVVRDPNAPAPKPGQVGYRSYSPDYFQKKEHRVHNFPGMSGWRFAPHLTHAERAAARATLRNQSISDQARLIAIMKKGGVFEKIPQAPAFAKQRARIMTALNKTAGGRRLAGYLKDPETQQFMKDVGVLGGAYIAARNLPRAKQFLSKKMQPAGDDIMDVLQSAHNPSRYEKFRRVFATRKKGVRNIWSALRTAWKAAL